MASNVKRDHHRWTRDITAPQDTTIDVEGDLTLDVSGGDLNIIDSSSAVLNPKLVITSNDTGAYGSVVQLKHNSSSPSSGDICSSQAAFDLCAFVRIATFLNSFENINCCSPKAGFTALFTCDIISFV